MVGGQHVPGRPFGAGVAQHVGVGPLVVVPVPPLPRVGRGELPVLLRPVDPLQEPGPLLRPGQVEEHLDHLDAVVHQVPFPVVDLAVAAGPQRPVLAVAGHPLGLGQFRVHPDDQHLLVVRPVEDADLTARGQPPRVPPQVVVAQFFGGRRLEAGHRDALWVHPAHHVLDRAVLAPGVQGLQHDQDPVDVLRGQPVLVFGQQPNPAVQHGQPVMLLVQTEPRAGVIVLGQVHGRTRRHPQRPDQPRNPVGVMLGRRHRRLFLPRLS